MTAAKVMKLKSLSRIDVDCSNFPCGNNDTKVLLCHVPPETNETGAAQGHTHGVDADDLRPAFTQFLFIIRVK